MRDVNLYTTSLFTAGLYAFFGYVLHFNSDHILLFLFVTALIVVLDAFPVTLPSGYSYSVGFIGFLYLVFTYGLGSSIIPLFAGTLVLFLRLSSWKITQMNWFRYFSTVGMYFLSVIAAQVAYIYTDSFHILFQVGVSVLAFDFVNALLHAGIHRSVFGTSIIRMFYDRLKELGIPSIVSTLALTRLLIIESTQEFIVEVLYTGGFLLLIIYFSSGYIKQIIQKEKHIQETQQKFQSLYDQNPDLVLSIDLKSKITNVNPVSERLLGYTQKALLGRPLAEILPLHEWDSTKGQIEAAFQGMPQNFEWNLTKMDGEPIVLDVTCGPHMENGQIVGLFAIAKDISEQKNSERLIYQMAFYDPLTNLPNRRKFQETLACSIENAKVNEQLVSVMLLDLDSFKLVNDSLGHEFGDRLLQEAAQRLSQIIRKQGDFISRLGGDEFVVILQNITDHQQIIEKAKLILKELEAPLFVEDIELRVTTSIGISIYPHDGEEVNTLVKRANNAMYRSKARGKNLYTFYTKEMDQEISRRFSLEKGLVHAIDHNEFLLHYQPLLDVRHQRVSGVEALIRWNQPGIGLISPEEFIPIAEASGWITAIGEATMYQACRQAVEWIEKGYHFETLSVNLSVKQFHDKSISQKIKKMLYHTGLNPSCLEIEITESVFINGVDGAVATINELRNMGIQIAIDDFGTGYSSLSYLTKIPVDKLKLDKSFIDQHLVDGANAEVIRTIIQLAHTLQIKVVAEGVDSIEKYNRLLEFGCDYIQGYWFSPPVPPHEGEAFLSKAPIKNVL
jgi:diguanylate cyclase (GGDEF)-like protein/PAS domain S-box-containing protein